MTDKLQQRESVTPGTGLDFVISDGSLDRHGTRINPKGWDLSNFKKNPIALFRHDPGFPIGTWSNVRNVGDQLVATLTIAAEGTSDRINEIIRLVAQSILRATSVGFDVLKYGKPGTDDYDFVEQELYEVSICAIGSNPNALAKARALNVSRETLSLVFGEPANERRGTVTNPGESAAKPPKTNRSPTMISKMIEAAQQTLNDMRGQRETLLANETFNLEDLEKLNKDIEAQQRTLAELMRAEKDMGNTAGRELVPAPAAAVPAVAGSRAAPAIVPRRSLGGREVDGLDLLVKSIAARGVSHFGKHPMDMVLDHHYRGNDALATFIRADQTIGTTTVSGWASELVQTVNQGFLDALMPMSIYAPLRSKGIAFSFDGFGTVSLPSRTAGGAGGGFTAEGAPIRVGRITTAAVTMTPRKLGVIVAFSKELAKRSTPQIEGLVRQAILEDTAVILDTALIDAVASSTARPAGLLNGVSATASGYGGGDYQAVLADFKALLAPFFAANAADNLVVIMNPAQGLALSMMPGPDGVIGSFMDAIRNRVTFIESTTVPSGRLIAVRASDFATATGDTPEFDVSETATLHMEDAVPLEIVSGTGPTTADPVRSLWQTNSVGVRMIQDVAWKMRRSGMVQWVDGVSW